MSLADKPLATVQVVDVADTARRVFGAAAEHIAGRPMPEHDYRFHMKTPTGGEVTFNQYATAQHVAEYCEREGWLSS